MATDLGSPSRSACVVQAHRRSITGGSLNLSARFHFLRSRKNFLCKVMSSAMDKAMMAMSLEEEDVPFDMPNLPEYSSCERNVLSLVGRTLNPDCQPMDHLIRTMPRKWQKIGRCRGVALSKERFQFFFNSEHDLVEVLEKGVHTFNEWTIVVDRWYEFPPDNYLQFTPMWIQLWNLPINFYTEKALTLLGDQIGQVKEVAFDTTKPQLQDFVRVKIIFDVSRPLRRTKIVNLPKGGTATVHFEYERVQKRCYECQRMTHEKDSCPLLLKKRQEASDARRAGAPIPRPKPNPVLKTTDPLFGVLNENQVGIDPATGRPRIALEVLEASGAPLLPAFSSKGESDRLWLSNDDSSCSAVGSGSFLALSQPYQNNATVYGPSSFAAGSSGNVLDKSNAKSRKRPSKSIRKLKPFLPKQQSNLVELSGGLHKGFKEKRKAVDVGTSTVKTIKLNPHEVIPKGGLFVLCTEGLSHLLNKAQWEGRLDGIQFSDNGPVVHHLLFADDSLFLCKASREQSLVLQNILKIYGDATGQTVNLSKSSITFGAKVEAINKGIIQAVLGISNEGGAGTYLGLPECFSGSKVDMLNYLKDRLKAKLAGWFTRCLSQGGKEVLLKSVSLAMPVFAMSCFKLPITTYENLESAMAAFWWDSCEHSRAIHWQSWERLCLPKDFGGLGFRDIQSFNQALLAKQAWRLLQSPECLLARLLKSRYYVNSGFLEAALSARPSFGWRSILSGRDLLSKGLLKKVGNGASLFVWIDPWIDDVGYRAPMRKNLFFDVALRVSSLLNPRTGFWDKDFLNDLFFPEDIIRIKAVKPVMAQEDFYIWQYNKSGDFTVKSAYWLADQEKSLILRNAANVQPSTLELKKLVWTLHTDPKIKIFLWKVLSGVLPVAENLNGRGMSVDVTCQIRDDVEEWFDAQRVDGDESARLGSSHAIEPNIDSLSGKRWVCSPPSWLKCNIGSSWSKRNNMAGGAWVLRDEKGSVLFHSRRAFGFILSKSDALLRCVLWAMESMASHKVDRVIFSFQDKSLVGAVMRPIAWPSFKAHAVALNRSLLPFVNWKVELEVAAANRGANLIAQSVTGDPRVQSYVAAGHPLWLNSVFIEEGDLRILNDEETYVASAIEISVSRGLSCEGEDEKVESTKMWPELYWSVTAGRVPVQAKKNQNDNSKVSTTS
ncbi:Reverse transcriptase zinc-binding domain [Arabidopsis suecica]|uniref:Reverse transcriptase zinc-binding domain n=1 Tax=Arabidopsis suecica TaxID=45249 RepID=A0A8T2AGP9_ARASU|nr:Reverse transcriptase zinc-binding domain [Arabidopsis suecica]